MAAQSSRRRVRDPVSPIGGKQTDTRPTRIGGNCTAARSPELIERSLGAERLVAHNRRERTPERIARSDLTSMVRSHRMRKLLLLGIAAVSLPGVRAVQSPAYSQTAVPFGVMGIPIQPQPFLGSNNTNNAEGSVLPGP